jgi:predicted peptidase
MSKRTIGSRQIAGAFEMTMQLRYLLFLPKRYGEDPDQKWPLILYLHGADERGDELERVKAHGIPKTVEEQPGFPFVCVSPQCPDEGVWMVHNLALKGLLGSILSTYAIDPDRVYLTGNSMGGYGAWGLGMAYPGTFAAIAPICGGGMSKWIASLTEVPVWAFHGAGWTKSSSIERGCGKSSVVSASLSRTRYNGSDFRFVVRAFLLVDESCDVDSVYGSTT